MAQAGKDTGLWRSVRDLSERTPLRVKLISAVLALVILALAVISFAGITYLKGYLINRADSQVQALAADNTSNGYALHSPVGLGPQVGERSLIEAIGPGGNAYAGEIFSRIYQLTATDPKIPASASWLAAHAGKPVTVPAEHGGDSWRVIVQPNQPVTVNTATGQQNVVATVVVGIDVTDIYATVNRLEAFDMLLSIGIVLILALLATAAVRASLRPLADIEETAGDIAAGNLSKRVPDRDPRTEVGRLGRSLNVMLSQIESAFHARSRSEESARRSEEKMRQFVADASHELRTPLTAIRGFAEYYRQRGGVAGADAVTAPSASEASPSGPSLSGASPSGASPSGASPSGASPSEASTARASTATPGADIESTAGLSAATASMNAANATGLGPVSNGSPLHSGRVHRGQLTSADMDRIMRRVEQESARMGVLVEDMLLLARLDQQRPLMTSPVDLLTLAADAVHDARVVAPARSINLTVSSGHALLVIGDEVRLRQVIGNLMSNAMTHTPDGTPIDVLIRSGNLEEAATATAVAWPDSAGKPDLGAGSGSADPDSAGPDSAGPDSAGPDSAGPDSAGPDSAGPDSAGPDSAGPDSAGTVADGAVRWDAEHVPPPPGSATTSRPAPPVPSGPAAVLEVTDHGPGLTRDQAERVFERFYRADPARTTGGNGLGLAIVAGLVTAHGGTAWVRSRPGEGATFCIALPLSPEAMQGAENDFDGEADDIAAETGTAGRAPGETSTSETGITETGTTGSGSTGSGSPGSGSPGSGSLGSGTDESGTGDMPGMHGRATDAGAAYPVSARAERGC